MTQTTHNGLTLALAAALLLGVGILARGQEASQAAQLGLQAEAVGGEALQKAEDLIEPSKDDKPRRRALSMPYFSFAQLLRPRS